VPGRLRIRAGVVETIDGGRQAQSFAAWLVGFRLKF
jgi:hypothetical protein